MTGSVAREIMVTEQLSDGALPLYETTGEGYVVDETAEDILRVDDKEVFAPLFELAANNVSDIRKAEDELFVSLLNGAALPSAESQWNTENIRGGHPFAYRLMSIEDITPMYRHATTAKIETSRDEEIYATDAIPEGMSFLIKEDVGTFAIRTEGEADMKFANIAMIIRDPEGIVRL